MNMIRVLCGLIEQFLGDHDRGIGEISVVLLERLFHQFCGPHHVIDVVDAERNLVEFHHFAFARAATANNDGVADALPHRTDGNIDVFGKILGFQRATDGRRRVAVFEHADDLIEVVMFLEVDRAAQRFFVGKQGLRDFGRQHAVVQLLIDFGVRDEVSPVDEESGHLGIFGSATH